MSSCDDPRFYECLCQAANFAMIAADDRLRICFWNELAIRMFGARPEPMLGAPVIEIFPDHARPEAQKLLDDALSVGTPGDLEFTQRDNSGKPLLLTAVISPVISSEGKRLGVSVCIRDITRRRELTRQLAQSRRMVSLGKMAGGVAHHFNSILGGAVTRLDFILSLMKPGDRHRKDLEKVTEAIGRAGRISGQLMTFAEGDHAPGHPRDLTQVVNEFIAESSAELEARNIRLVTQIEPIRATQVESRRLRAVLDSLKHNSVEAMASGGDLIVGLRESDGRALLTIADTGCGIPEDQMERLFEPFFTTKGELGGGAGKNTGLSLSVVHSFIKDMGGEIGVSSVARKGTRFEICLPVGRGPEEKTANRPGKA